MTEDGAITNSEQQLSFNLNELKKTFENKLFNQLHDVKLSDINKAYTTYLNNTNESLFKNSIKSFCSFFFNNLIA